MLAHLHIEAFLHFGEGAHYDMDRLKCRQIGGARALGQRNKKERTGPVVHRVTSRSGQTFSELEELDPSRD